MDVTRASRAVDALLDYARNQGLLAEGDSVWARNVVLSLIGADAYAFAAVGSNATTCEDIGDEALTDATAAPPDPEPLLAELVACARAAGVVEEGYDASDRLCCAIMNAVMPRPSEVNKQFALKLAQEGSEAACQYLYHISQAAAYVHAAASLRDIKWNTPSTWGDLEITINLSKPEKDPRAIAALAAKKPAAAEDATDVPPYPSCQLCLDNEGYAGRLPGNARGAHPARQNLRIVRIPLDVPIPNEQDEDVALVEALCETPTGRARSALVSPCAETCATSSSGQVDAAANEQGEGGHSALVEEQLAPCDETCAGWPSSPGQVESGQWAMQYSPYAYYNEHCIVINPAHEPMHIDESTFRRLLAFVDLIPEYFIGSNADLPIVGGSILNHDHFQAGRHVFPMDRAAIDQAFSIPGFDNVAAGVVKWPLSVLRLESEDREALIAAAVHILDAWRAYSDPSVGILAETAGERHNTITPIARHEGGLYRLNLALRCNITSDEHPLGVFHPHKHLHHIKRENIGLIEVMGLAILPARLSRELAAVEETLVSSSAQNSNADAPDKKLLEALEADEQTAKHAEWACDVAVRHPELDAANAQAILRDEVGAVFREVLECAGVFKWDDAGRAALSRFIATL